MLPKVQAEERVVFNCSQLWLSLVLMQFGGITVWHSRVKLNQCIHD